MPNKLTFLAIPVSLSLFAATNGFAETTSPIKLGAPNMILLPAMPTGKMLILPGNGFVNISGEDGGSLTFLEPGGKTTGSATMEGLPKKTKIAVVRRGAGGDIVAGGASGARACPWVGRISQQGKVRWQLCVVDRGDNIRRGDILTLRLGQNGQIQVFGSLLVDTPDGWFRVRNFRATLAKGRVVRRTFLDDEFEDATLVREFHLRGDDKGETAVYLVRTKRSSQILLVERDPEGRRVNQISLALTSHGPPPARLFLPAALAAANGDVLIFFHGYYRGVLQQRYARFSSFGLQLWTRGWTFQQIAQRKGGFKVGTVVERKNGEFLAFGEKSITRIAGDGRLLETVMLKEGEHNHIIHSVLRSPTGEVFLRGRYYKKDGSGRKWLVKLGNWPGK
jgi:hypothetical protein